MTLFSPLSAAIPWRDKLTRQLSQQAVRLSLEAISGAAQTTPLPFEVAARHLASAAHTTEHLLPWRRQYADQGDQALADATASIAALLSGTPHDSKHGQAVVAGLLLEAEYADQEYEDLSRWAALRPDALSPEINLRLAQRAQVLQAKGLDLSAAAQRGAEGLSAHTHPDAQRAHEIWSAALWSDQDLINPQRSGQLLELIHTSRNPRNIRQALLGHPARTRTLLQLTLPDPAEVRFQPTRGRLQELSYGEEPTGEWRAARQDSYSTAALDRSRRARPGEATQKIGAWWRTLCEDPSADVSDQIRREVESLSAVVSELEPHREWLGERCAALHELSRWALGHEEPGAPERPEADPDPVDRAGHAEALLRSVWQQLKDWDWPDLGARQADQVALGAMRGAVHAAEEALTAPQQPHVALGLDDAELWLQAWLSTELILSVDSGPQASRQLGTMERASITGPWRAEADEVGRAQRERLLNLLSAVSTWRQFQLNMACEHVDQARMHLRRLELLGGPPGFYGDLLRLWAHWPESAASNAFAWTGLNLEPESQAGEDLSSARATWNDPDNWALWERWLTAASDAPNTQTVINAFDACLPLLVAAQAERAVRDLTWQPLQAPELDDYFPTDEDAARRLEEQLLELQLHLSCAEARALSGARQSNNQIGEFWLYAAQLAAVRNLRWTQGGPVPSESPSAAAQGADIWKERATDLSLSQTLPWAQFVKEPRWREDIPWSGSALQTLLHKLPSSATELARRRLTHSPTPQALTPTHTTPLLSEAWLSGRAPELSELSAGLRLLSGPVPDTDPAIRWRAEALLQRGDRAVTTTWLRGQWPGDLHYAANHD